MKLSLTSITTWQTLRVLARGGNAPLTGKALRVDRSRSSKDGTFLDDLVALGLLEIVAPAAPVQPRHPGGAVEPAQFRTTYRLTPAGLATADTGEYDKPDPNPVPVYDNAAPRPVPAVNKKLDALFYGTVMTIPPPRVPSRRRPAKAKPAKRKGSR